LRLRARRALHGSQGATEACSVSSLRFRLRGLAVLTVPGALLVSGPLLHAQGVHASLSGQAVFASTDLNRGPRGRSFNEAKLVQPVLMLHGGALGDRLRLLATFNAEGWTMPGGELTIGGLGEGINDSRHPHTYVHELMFAMVDVLGQWDGPGRVSLSLGKGFAPFGTDDPMGRPALKYPVNHHFSQILERAVAIVGVEAGALTLEGGLFNGDEPERPGEWPLVVDTAGNWRFGDSWSLRLLVHPLHGLELQGSRAKVHSPEHRPGAGTDVFKWSISGRMDREFGASRAYAMAEWARTTEANDFFRFESILAEGAWQWGSHRPYYRFERTDRPEDMRTLDLFRSVRPHLENAILGTTRWTLHTLGYRFSVRGLPGRAELEPFGELTLARARKLGGGVFDPALFYGGTTFRSVSVGVRLGWGMAGHRMGRYGVLDSETHMGPGHHEH